MGKREDDAFGDAVYEAWRHGLNPDRVDRDRVADDCRRGLDRFECAENEVSRLMAERAKREAT